MKQAHSEDSWLESFLTLYKTLSSMKKKDFQHQIEKVLQEIHLNQESLLQNENTPINNNEESINSTTHTKEIENNEQPNGTISAINEVQQENEIENSEQPNEAITTIITEVQQEILCIERPNEAITTIITEDQQEIEEIILEIHQIQQVQQTTDVVKTPKLLREIKMRDKTVICPHTKHSFFCYCERPQLTTEYIKKNKKTPISNNRTKQVSTNSINRILETYGTIYGEMNTCLPNEFYSIVLRTLIDIPQDTLQDTQQKQTNRKRKNTTDIEEVVEIGSITQIKRPLDTELSDEKFQLCRDVIHGFDISLWFHDKDKVNNCPILSIQIKNLHIY